MADSSVVEVVVPIVTGVLAVIGSFTGNYAMSLKKSREDAIKDAEREQSQRDQFDRLFAENMEIKKRLDEHNHYAEKFAENSKQIAVIIERQVQMQKDIDYLKSQRRKV